MPLPFASIIPAVLGAAGSVGGSLLDRATSAANIDRQGSYDRSLAEYTFGKNLEMWNMQNAYNSPQQQMQRLKEAGLNPNLVYGNGAVGNAAGAAPRYEQPRTDVALPAAINFPAMLSMYNDTVVKAAQVDNIKANTMATLANATGRSLANDLAGAILGDRKVRAGLENDLLSSKRLLTDTVQGRQATEAGTAGIKQSLLRQYGGAEAQLKLNLGGANLTGRQIANKWAELGVSNPLNLGISLLSRMLPVGLNQSFKRKK